jgi:hypothetical protein
MTALLEVPVACWTPGYVRMGAALATSTTATSSSTSRAPPALRPLPTCSYLLIVAATCSRTPCSRRCAARCTSACRRPAISWRRRATRCGHGGCRRARPSAPPGAPTMRRPRSGSRRTAPRLPPVAPVRAVPRGGRRPAGTPHPGASCPAVRRRDEVFAGTPLSKGGSARSSKDRTTSVAFRAPVAPPAASPTGAAQRVR